MIVSFKNDQTGFGNKFGLGGVVPGFTSQITSIPRSTTGDVSITLEYFGDFDVGGTTEALTVNIEGVTFGPYTGPQYNGAFGPATPTTVKLTIDAASWATIIQDGIIHISYDLGTGFNNISDAPGVEEFVKLTFTWDAPIQYNAINGGAGNDRLKGTGGNDSILGFDGNDTITGGDGHDRIQGGNGNDRIFAGAGDQGNDMIFGEGGDDLIYGGRGDDHLFGGTGADTMYGGKGNDYLWGDVGNDVLYGGQGNDKLLGNAGDDKIYNGAGSDTVYGGEGADTIFGGAGDDLLYGGDEGGSGDGAADVFFFTATSGKDTIGDFERGIDVIDLSQLGVDFSDLTINGNVVTINGIAPSDLTITVTGSTLTESDFVFH